MNSKDAMTTRPGAIPDAARRKHLIHAAACLTWFAGAPAFAQSYPSRPVRFILPYGPGSGPEVIMRLISEPLSKRLGQSIVVDNKPGAAGILAMQEIMKAPADGHSFVLGDVGNLAINPQLHHKLPYDPPRDLTIVTDLLSVPWVFWVSKDSPYKTFAQFAAAARARPDELTYGTSGRGAPNSMVVGLLQHKTGLVLREIPHSAGTATYTNVVSGRVDLVTASHASVKAFVSRLTPLATSGAERDKALPDVPTLIEATGIANFDLLAWSLIMARAETPAPLVQRMREELIAVLAMPPIQERMAELGMKPGGTADVPKLQHMLARDAKAFAEVVAAQKIEKQ